MLEGYDPRFRFLSAENLQRLPDSEVIDAIHDHAVLTMGQDCSPEPELVASLREGVRAAWAVNLYELIMGNGGLHLLFWTTDEPSAETILAGLRYIEATEHIALLSEALDRAERTQDWLMLYRMEGSYEAFCDWFWANFRGLDARYWGLPNLTRILVRAVRDHRERFCSP